MTAFKITLLACQWLLLSAQTIADKPVLQPPPDVFFNPKPLAANYLEWMRRMNYLPPDEFDHYNGEVKIVRGTQQQLRDACPNSFRPGNHAIGCAKRMLDGATCTVYILNDIGLQAIGWDYQIVLRHELGHCAGWQHPQ